MPIAGGAMPSLGTKAVASRRPRRLPARRIVGRDGLWQGEVADVQGTFLNTGPAEGVLAASLAARSAFRCLARPAAYWTELEPISRLSHDGA